jgi:hypothetical protein
MSYRNAWLAAAAVLLLVGAGCGESVPAYTPIQNAPDITPPAVQPPADQPTSQEATPTGVAADADAAAAASLQEMDDETAAEQSENDDASVMQNDTTDLNAYSQAYDSSNL